MRSELSLSLNSGSVFEKCSKNFLVCHPNCMSDNKDHFVTLRFHSIIIWVWLQSFHNSILFRIKKTWPLRTVEGQGDHFSWTKHQGRMRGDHLPSLFLLLLLFSLHTEVPSCPLGQKPQELGMFTYLETSVPILAIVLCGGLSDTRLWNLQQLLHLA